MVPAGVAHDPEPFKNCVDVPESAGKNPCLEVVALFVVMFEVDKFPSVTASHVASPRQNVAALAPVPELRLVTGILPKPMLPLELIVPPVKGELAVMLVTVPAGGVAHVPSPLQKVEALAPVPEFRLPTGILPNPILPLEIIVPPVSGDVAVILVSVPPPPGVAQVPSPLQNVVDEASIP